MLSDHTKKVRRNLCGCVAQRDHGEIIHKRHAVLPVVDQPHGDGTQLLERGMEHLQRVPARVRALQHLARAPDDLTLRVASAHAPRRVHMHNPVWRCDFRDAATIARKLAQADLLRNGCAHLRNQIPPPAPAPVGASRAGGRARRAPGSLISQMQWQARTAVLGRQPGLDLYRPAPARERDTVLTLGRKSTQTSTAARHPSTGQTSCLRDSARHPDAYRSLRLAGWALSRAHLPSGR